MTEQQNEKVLLMPNLQTPESQRRFAKVLDQRDCIDRQCFTKLWALLDLIDAYIDHPACPDMAEEFEDKLRDAEDLILSRSKETNADERERIDYQAYMLLKDTLKFIDSYIEIPSDMARKINEFLKEAQSLIDQREEANDRLLHLVAGR